MHHSLRANDEFAKYNFNSPRMDTNRIISVQEQKEFHEYREQQFQKLNRITVNE